MKQGTPYMKEGTVIYKEGTPIYKGGAMCARFNQGVVFFYTIGDPI